VGVVAVNFDIATQGFVTRIGNTFDVDVTVFAGDTSIASTLIHPDTGEPAVGTPVRADIAEEVLGRGEGLALQLDVFGTLPYSAYYFPLFGADGRTPVGMFFVGIPQAEALATINAQILYIIVIGIIGLAIAVMFLYLLINKSMKPLDNLRVTVKEIAAGNVGVNVDRSKSLPKEIEALTTDVCGLAGVIRDMIADLSSVHSQYLIEGNIHYSIDESKYQNAFKEMIKAMNTVTAAVTADITSLVDTMNQIGNGDFDKRLDVKTWTGDWVFVPQAVNNLSDGLKSVSTEVNAMIKAVATNGDMSFQIDTTKYTGDWREIMSGLNDIAKAVDSPLKAIAMGMKEMKGGNFDLAEIDRKFTANSLNADPEQYRGVFRDIIAAFDETITAIGSYISEISNKLSDVAQGDLTKSITREYVGDFSIIKESLNSISSTLHKTMSGISNAADHVLAGANQISTNAADLASGAQEQSSSVQELNASIEMISQQTLRNADNAATANELSNKSTENAGEGANAMKQMIAAMEQIKESSSNIGQIVKTVQDIAFQTNLLALNASVEAARAGEHGKGFAVVADEVRTLAGRSQVAATETTALITDSINRVDAGAGIAETTAESLNAIVESAGEVLEVISSISAASKEQAEAIEQISSGIAQISNVTQTNTAVSEETAAASQELNAQAETLRQLVGYFKL
ncbi:MAG: methyl-accepting chemotaxis protein, partial [Defluviitaleaceae bacterium]|nr:methyl-accepting chemotaxis protein [Defluviitaleaceae bacterium]